MFKSTRRVLPGLRHLHYYAPGPSHRSKTIVASSGILLGTLLCYSQTRFTLVHNDSVTSPVISEMSPSKVFPQDGELHTMVWGSNKSRTLSLDEYDPESLRAPAIASWAKGIAFRDLAVHADHAACIDAKGDVYQWGKGHFGSDTANHPQLSLKNKNIVQLQLTKSRLFALSASGRIYCMEIDRTKQALRLGGPTPSSDLWWSTGWLWGKDESVDLVEIKPQHGLERNESFKSISAGDNHLLALTSSGRAFAHPINKYANFYGQLGFRKIEIPQPESPLRELSVQLIPKSSPKGSWTGNDTIRSCPFIFEIPSLKGVPIAQITAGSRTSFVRTSEGRALGWGANEFGQIGLGANVTLDTITVPTEIVLSRMSQSRGQCIDICAGGDLTGFIVESSEGNTTRTVDILMCGNGQWGGLGNNLFSNVQGVPLRTRGTSGLTEYDEKKKAIVPILPQALSISRTGHVVMTLNTSVGAKDLFVWGKNHDSELGNGKKSSVPVPTTLSVDQERIMLRERKGVNVKDLQGRVWGRADVEQRALAGYNNTFVYWRIQ